MICWSCEKNAGEGMLCGSCGAIQPPNRGANHFQVLGLANQFALDVAELERRYKDMTKILHPDRFARADARARRASLERSVQINEAWRTLSDPVRRAEYILACHGIEVGEVSGDKRGAPTAKPTQPVSPVLLMEIMELRESLADARAAGDSKEVSALSTTVTNRQAEAMAFVAEEFAKPAPDLGAIASRLVSVRYYRRFLEEAKASQEAHEDAAHESH
jgi:molecular chaperone HscB